MKIGFDIKLILIIQLIYPLYNVGWSLDFLDSAETDDSASIPILRHTHRRYRPAHHHRKSYDHDIDTSGEDEDCYCSCNKCDNPTDCCRSFCRRCPKTVISPMTVPETYLHHYAPNPGLGAGLLPDPSQSQSSVFFVPYPYPVPVPNVPKSNSHAQAAATTLTTTPSTTSSTTSTTTSTTTTTTTTTTTEAPTTQYQKPVDNVLLESVLKSVVDDYPNLIVKTPDKLKNANNKYMLTSLRRTKPAWMPKFGIVPISDNMAHKLMSQLKAKRVPLRRQT